MIHLKGIDIDPEQLFDVYGLENVAMMGSQNLNAACPFHEDNSRHLGMNIESGLWNCFVCGEKGNLVQFVMKMNECSYQEAIRFLQNLGTANVISSNVVRDKLHSLLKSRDENRIKRISYTISLHPYLANRGFTQESCNLWEIGYLDLIDRIIIPAKGKDKKIKGYIYRSVKEGEKPKYLYTAGEGWKSGFLFGEHLIANNTKEVVLVEGPLDAIWLRQNGINAVALLGASLSEKQKIILAKYQTVVLMLDNDIAGKGAMYGEGKVGDTLCAQNLVFVVHYPKGRNDPQECSENELKEMLDSKLSFTALKSSKQLLHKGRGK